MVLVFRSWECHTTVMLCWLGKSQRKIYKWKVELNFLCRSVRSCWHLFDCLCIIHVLDFVGSPSAPGDETRYILSWVVNDAHQKSQWYTSKSTITIAGAPTSNNHQPCLSSNLHGHQPADRPGSCGGSPETGNGLLQWWQRCQVSRNDQKKHEISRIHYQWSAMISHPRSNINRSIPCFVRKISWISVGFNT